MKTDHKNHAVETSKNPNIDIRENDGVACKLIPIGTFAGTIERAVLFRNGEIFPSNSGDQGSGQN
jgi:hypothetical protein